ncbi:MAG: AAA family ATPase [Actinomycetes bacterium]
MGDKKDYKKLLLECQITKKTKFDKERIYVSIGNSVIGSQGGFVTITGLPKSCKSTFLMGLIASAISSKQVFGFSTFLNTYPDKNRVCLFDTEHSGLDFQSKIRQVQKLSGIADIYDAMDIFSVVELSVWDILNCINTYLENNPSCAILCIDGLLDLIENLNDEKSSKRLTKIIRKWAKKHECLIVGVLHLGKDRTAIGHIGSSVSRYCQSQLEITKTKENTYVMEGRLLRSAGHFQSVEIMYSEKNKSFIQL